MVGRPDPLFLGVAALPGIQVARWQDAAGRNTFAAYLDVRLGPESGEGTTLTGRIGLHPDVQELLPVFGGIACLFSLGILAAGAVQLASGRLSGLLPALLFWIPATALAGFNALGLRSLERDVPKLLEEVNGVLDSTATFPRSSAVPAGGSKGA